MGEGREVDGGGLFLSHASHLNGYNVDQRGSSPIFNVRPSSTTFGNDYLIPSINRSSKGNTPSPTASKVSLSSSGGKDGDFYGGGVGGRGGEGGRGGNEGVGEGFVKGRNNGESGMSSGASLGGVLLKHMPYLPSSSNPIIASSMGLVEGGGKESVEGGGTNTNPRATRANKLHVGRSAATDEEVKELEQKVKVSCGFCERKINKMAVFLLLVCQQAPDSLVAAFDD